MRSGSFRVPLRRHKYGAVATSVDGIMFHSAKEAAVYSRLKLLREQGKLDYFLRQVPFDLPGGVKYMCDFMLIWKHTLGITIEWVDVKGYDTPVSKMKRKQVEALYGVKISIW